MTSSSLLHYISTATIDEVEDKTLRALKRALTDIIACTVAGTETEAATISTKIARSQWGGGNSSIFLSKEKLTPTGAAFVNATMANALDLDDGHRLTKGHPGAVVFPAVLAVAEDLNVNGKDFLNSLLVGYEIAIRAGISAHDERQDYHCTGSWGAIGAAAGVSRLMKLTNNKVEHALGIAEFYGTYSPMMRCIEYPTMVKDSINWGCMTGTSSAYLAKEGYTGIPSSLSEHTSTKLIDQLGKHNRINEMYYKPYACCRWAQPAIECMKSIHDQLPLDTSEIETITIHTFREASLLSKSYPKNTEEAQYNLFFPLAAYLIYGEVGPKQVLHQLDDQIIKGIMDKMTVQTLPEFDEAFPQKAYSRVDITRTNGETLLSPVMQARGDYDYPLREDEMTKKFMWLVTPILGKRKASTLLDLIDQLEEVRDIREFTNFLSN